MLPRPRTSPGRAGQIAEAGQGSYSGMQNQHVSKKRPVRCREEWRNSCPGESGKVLLLAAALALGPVAAVTAQTAKQLRVTIPVIGMNSCPCSSPSIKDCLPRKDSMLRSFPRSGDGPDVDALIAGSVQFTISTPNRLLTSFEQGKPLLAIMNMANRNAIDCVINKDTAGGAGSPRARRLTNGSRP